MAYFNSLRELGRAGLWLDREEIGGAVSRSLQLAVGSGAIRIWESGGAR